MTVMYYQVSYLSVKRGNSSRILADFSVSNCPEEVSVTPPSIHYYTNFVGGISFQASTNIRLFLCSSSCTSIPGPVPVGDANNSLINSLITCNHHYARDSLCNGGRIVNVVCGQQKWFRMSQHTIRTRCRLCLTCKTQLYTTFSAFHIGNGYYFFLLH